MGIGVFAAMWGYGSTADFGRIVFSTAFAFVGARMNTSCLQDSGAGRRWVVDVKFIIDVGGKEEESTISCKEAWKRLVGSCERGNDPALLVKAVAGRREVGAIALLMSKKRRGLQQKLSQ